MISPSKIHPHFWPPVWSDSQLAADVEDLALKIAGDDAFGNILALAGDAGASALIPALARDVAEAQIDQDRVRRVQDELSRDLPPAQGFGDLVRAAKLTKKNSPERSIILGVYQHERRVLSRRKKADRVYDAARRRQKRKLFRLAKRLQRRVNKRANGANAA